MNSKAALARRLEQALTPLALVQSSARRPGGHPALVFMRTPDDDEPVVMSYAELAESSERAAGAFLGLGLGPQDAVALLLPASPDAVVAFLAALSVGVAFPLNPLLSVEAMAAQLALAGAQAAVVWGGPEGDDAAGRLREAARGVPGLQTIIEMAPDGDSGPWRTLVRGAARAGSPVGPPERTAALFHTGGTTGEPKLAELSARGMAAGALMASWGTGWNQDDRVCVALPLFHVGGALACVLNALATGATVIFPGARGARDPALIADIWNFVGRTRTSILAMVPTSLTAIVEIATGAAELSDLRAICTGAAPLPLELKKRLEAKLGVPVCQIYGMTEMSGFCTAQPCDGRFRDPAAGFPPSMLDVEMRLPDGRKAERGEVFLKGPNTFLGYRTSAGRTGCPADGWVASGDLGVFGEDGQLRLEGRSKDVIIRGGHNIDPLTIEETAQQHPAVRISAAVAMPDAYAGELPVLYVALRAGEVATPEEIAAFVAARIAEPPARPKRVIILEELPLTPVGKVARYRLRQMAAGQDAAGEGP